MKQFANRQLDLKHGYKWDIEPFKQELRLWVVVSKRKVT